MIKIYRKIALIEAISYLLLLFVAMPLKYVLHIPEPVRYFGCVHGGLFVLFIGALLICWMKYRWMFIRVLAFFLGSLIPFVPFYLDKILEDENTDR